MTRPEQRPSSRWRLPMALALVFAVLWAPVAAWSWWSAESDLSVTASAAVLAPPASLTCTTHSLLGLLPSVELDWQAPPGPRPQSYDVVVSVGTDSGVLRNVPGNQLSTTITVGLLTDGVLGWLVDLLAGGTTAAVTVQARQGDWVSAPTNGRQIRLALTGVRCA